MNELSTNCTFKKVMLIDDTAVDRYIAERNIIKYLFAEEVVVKESANEGLKYLASLVNNPEQLPQLIFLDIRMPEKNGFQFLEEYEILPDAVKKTCIIMMLSTSLNASDHEMAKGNKYVAKFINKPLNSERIMELISEAGNMN